MKKTKREKRKLKTKEYHWEKMISECMRLNKKENIPSSLTDIILEMNEIACDPEEDDSLRISLIAILLHYTSGQQTFDLSNKIYEMFLRTDLKNVYLKDIMLPYDCLYVAFPREHEILISNEQGIPIKHICNGIYLYKKHHDFKDEMIHISIPTHNIPAAPMLEDNIHRYGAGVSSTINFSQHIQNQDKESPFNLDKIIDSLLGKFERTNSKENTKLFKEVISVAFNTIIYLNHGLEKEVIQRQNRKELQKFIKFQETATSPKEKNKIDRIITKLSIANVTSLEPSFKGLRLNEMTATDVLVRGHWHTYWVGEGRTKRKVNWVQPHIRNKTDTKLDKIQARQYSI